jgi:methylase of polypeptide subunit release factors
MRRSSVDPSVLDRHQHPLLARRDATKLLFLAIITLGTVFFCSCQRRVRDDLDYSFNVVQQVDVPELPGQTLVQFESVFWEPDDTISLRQQITEKNLVEGRRVLEIGTGTGLLSLLCLANGASEVVATDINKAAVSNARYNAAMLEMDESFEVRQVEADSPGAFAVIKADERFDVILSNPPWEDGSITKPADHAFYDPNFALMDSLLRGLPNHLNPGGRCLLAYGHKPAITRLLSRAKQIGFQTRVLDDRKLDELPEDFLPGMLIELRLSRTQNGKVDSSKLGTATVDSETETP